MSSFVKRLKHVRISQVLKPLLSVALGLALGLLVTKIAGENPWNVFKILVHSAFGSRYDLGMTLAYATPLIFTGLSVSFAFHAGLFNIGAEGQLAVGAFVAAAIGSQVSGLPPFVAPVVAGVGAALGGGLWAAIPGYLRAKRGSHEVINTIMLNFVAAGLCGWATLYLIPNPDSQNPETATIAKNFMIPHFSFFGEAPVTLALPLALLVAFGVWFVLWKTSLGFEIRAVGQNENAARTAGISSGKVRILSMACAGALAGLVGVSEVLGVSSRFKLGFSPGYGFMGIAVALLGRNRPFGVVLAALLFGALHKGTSDLDLETENVTRDISQILQAAVILCVSAEGLWDLLLRKRKSNGMV